MKEPSASVPADIYPTTWANGCALFASRAVFETVGLMDTDYVGTWDEVDWCFRATRKGFRCAIQPEARVAHRVSATFSSTSSYWQDYLFFRNRILFVRRHYGHLAALKSVIGLFILAIRTLAQAVIRQDKPQCRKGIAQLQASLHGALGRFGSRQPWLNGTDKTARMIDGSI